MQVALANRITFTKLVVVAIAMFGFGFALTPFYKKLCDAIGINELDKADAVVNTQVDAARWVTLELDANLRNAMPWTFRPVGTSVRIHPGQLVHLEYEVANNSAETITGQAIASYGPQLVSAHVRKLECFCFKQQTLRPGEHRRMPVALVIGSTLPRGIDTVTLSYTFFRVEAAGAGKG